MSSLENPADGGAPSTATSGHIVPGRWRKLGFVAAPLWADNNETSIVSTLAPVIISALALPLSALGVLVSTSKGITIFAGPMWAFLARKTNRKTVFVIATLINGVATAAIGLSQNWIMMISLWALSAVFVAAAIPIVTEITTDLFDENSRGRANGYTWGAISILGSVLGPLIGQLARVEDGWRYGFYGWGALQVIIGIALALGFKDPGLGASEPTTSLQTLEQRRENSRITLAKLRQLFTIPTFVIMLGQRLLSGHLLVASFGVTFLVQKYGFDTATAAIVTGPFGIGYLVGTLAGGVFTDLLERALPRRGRILVLQLAQLGFGAAALIGMQFDWGSIGIFGAFWAVMGFMQGINPGVNRPIVSSVVAPELRGTAFAVMLSVFEALAFVIFNLVAGFLGQTVGLIAVMLWIPGVLMLINGAYCTLLYRTYPRDVAQLETLLQARTNSTPTITA